jgi:uncharacterized protein (DUF2141 family)
MGLSLVLTALPVGAAELRISIDGIRSAKGTVLIGLYDSPESYRHAIEAAGEEGFLNDPQRFAAVALRANAALKSSVVFSNLQPGRYAVIAFHDENSNGKLDKNALGVPTEPYAFSNNVQGFLGPPTFDKAAIAINNRDMEVHLTLIYHRSADAASCWANLGCWTESR